MKTSHYFQSKSTEEIAAFFHSIFNISSDGLYICDDQGHTLLFNHSFLEISGIPEELLWKYSVFELVEMDAVPNSCAAVTIRTLKPHDTIIDYYNGKKAILTSSPIFEDQKLVCVVSNVRDITELNRLQRELEQTRQMNSKFQEVLLQIQGDYQSSQQFVYRSKEMHTITSLAARFAKNDSPILLLGESGVGKDVLAHYIHQQSGRVGSFVKINCGAIPDHLLESELFGYEKGAFTGANRPKEGLFELADKGTIFLDEIGDLPYALQVKLLNVLQEQKIRRLGGVETIEVDMRIIAATNVDLEQRVEKKRFRHDLYYRLNVLSLTIPPLRQRKDDIAALIFYFLDKLEQKYGEKKSMGAHELEKWIAYNWPGNIRELKNMVERAYHMSDHSRIQSDVLHYSARQNRDTSFSSQFQHLFDQPLALKQAVLQFERDYIRQALAKSRTMKECADKLNIDISTLVRKKQKLGL
ncbi:sigma 54-interacting transcriptional regulator [Brevibacillus humidisoli]|uniref:sigma-54 interaction domain-containing protein n=1 Tax=Brevibacillus humidisoli TaxID=2895522 RepID=UPI001E5B1EFD|nr:sigma 54-interacting transcriptional regulator [Brevibacillus humidisoli]UFJ42620.1 sigma 54-interacting transcriptional regulator [Brevibacillus humidisoli]